MDDYRLAIENAKVSDASDRRLELSSCVQKWVGFEKERSGVYDLLARERIRELPEFLFIEFGTSGFGSYQYALLYRDSSGGHVITNLHGGSTPISAIAIATEIESLFKQIEAAQPIEGMASSAVYDGQCVFVNFKAENSFSQFGLYAPDEQGMKGDDKSNMIVNLILEFISRVVPPDS